jgi:DNA-binding NarL/FixJ family response regulator
MQAARVLVVDDFKEWRDFARTALEKVAGLVVVAEASDGLEAVQKAEKLQPDLVVLDVGLPALNGIDVARQIERSCQNSRVVFLTENHSRDVVEEALQARASAYVLKSSAATELVPAVNAALNGGTHAEALVTPKPNCRTFHGYSSPKNF